MKKVLATLGALALMASGATGVVSCQPDDHYVDKTKQAIDAFTDKIDHFLRDCTLAEFDATANTFAIITPDGSKHSQNEFVPWFINNVLDNSSSDITFIKDFHLIDYVKDRGIDSSDPYLTASKDQYGRLSFMSFQTAQFPDSVYEVSWRTILNNRKNFYNFMPNNFYEIASSWPVKMAGTKTTKVIYWQGVITDRNNYYAIYAAQGNVNKDGALVFRWESDLITIAFKCAKKDIIHESDTNRDRIDVIPFWKNLEIIPTFKKYEDELKNAALFIPVVTGEKEDQAILNIYSEGGDGASDGLKVYSNLKLTIIQ